MPKSRLNLNFSLNSSQERIDFLKSPNFSMPSNPTSKELSQISDYILWGNKKENSKLLDSKWTLNPNTISYEDLVASPTFNENILTPLNPPTKYKKEIFSREEARFQAPPHILEELEDLWRRIDALELSINLYEIDTGRRIKPPRTELVERTDSTLIHTFDSQKSYLDARHLLIELRRDQYALRDRYKPTPILPHTQLYDLTPSYIIPTFNIKPFPLYSQKTSLFYKIHLKPILNESQLKILYEMLWMQPHDDSPILDFSDTSHLAILVTHFYEFETAAANSSIESQLSAILKTFKFYINFADLSPIYKSILYLKFEGASNIKITQYINKKFEKSYNNNYISTLYHHKVLTSIADAALLHRKILENLFYPENFKVCKDCGHLYLKDVDCFAKRMRTYDGWAVRCKKCDKKRRQRKKDEAKKKL